MEMRASQVIELIERLKTASKEADPVVSFWEKPLQRFVLIRDKIPSDPENSIAHTTGEIQIRVVNFGV